MNIRGGLLRNYLILLLFFASCSSGGTHRLPGYDTRVKARQGAREYRLKASQDRNHYRACLEMEHSARLYEEAGDKVASMRMWRALRDRKSCSEKIRARAMLKLSGSWNSSDSALLALMRRYPCTPAAEDAISFLLKRWLSGSGPGNDGLVRAEKLSLHRCLEDDRAWILGGYLRRSGRLRMALVWFRRLGAMVGSPLQDDGLFAGARLAHRLGRTALAASMLETLVSSHRSSWILGRYDSDLMDDALWELAAVRMDQHMPEEALEVLDLLISRYPASRLVDDALHMAAKILDGRGDRSGACRKYSRLLRLRPDSRYTSLARAYIAKHCRGR